MKSFEPLGFSWAYRDLLIALVIVFLAFSVLSLSITNQKTIAGLHPGNISIEMQWPYGSKADVDLWVKSPNDEPVGYQRKSGLVCNLLLDDLGDTHTNASRAMEITSCRGVLTGQPYIVNVVLYSWNDAPHEPIPVHVMLTMVKDNGMQTFTTEKDIILRYEQQEMTVWQFVLDQDGIITSINDIYYNLYPGGLHD